MMVLLATWGPPWDGFFKVSNNDWNGSVENEEAKLAANEPILEKAADGTVLAQIRTLLNIL